MEAAGMRLADRLVGRRLDGRYLIQAPIARGGMAAVYNAIDTRLDRRVAVKVMHGALAEDPAFVARFHREAKAAASIDHPAVVAVTDQGDDDGTIFLVMELVVGRTLRSLLRERGRLTPAEALEIIEPVLAGLGAAHTRGLVHRDVKPENVLLGDDGRVKVTDFGLARAAAASPLTAATGVLIGTVAYLAPEQVQTGAADTRTDVYAAGVLLYEMLTGEQPYAGDAPITIAYRHVNESVPVPGSRLPGIPGIVDDLVAVATAKDPGARYPDAPAFRAAVRAARHSLARPLPADTSVLPLADAHTVVTPVPLPERRGWRERRRQTSPRPAVGPPDAAGAIRRRRRWRRRIALVTALLLVTGGAAGTAWWFGSGRYVSAPDFARLTSAQATTLAGQRHMQLEFVSPIYSDTVPKDRVAAQDPGVGRRLPRGGHVQLALSLGEHLGTVPDLRGKPLAEAQGVLRAQGLIASQSGQQYDESVPAGRILSQSERPGASLHVGTSVALVLSQGPKPRIIPGDLAGKAFNDAAAEISALGLAPTRNDVFSDTVQSGFVLGSIPAAAATVPKGGLVTLNVSKGAQLFRVPDVQGQSKPDAARTLAAAGFRVEIFDLPDSTGGVISQSPGAGSLKPHGTVVTIYVL